MVDANLLSSGTRNPLPPTNLVKLAKFIWPNLQDVCGIVATLGADGL